MDFLKIIDTLPQSVYLKLKQAVEIGKWENGTPLTEQQKAHTLQAVMAWQAKHLDSQQQFTIAADGKIIEKSRAELEQDMANQQIIRLKHDDF